MNATAREALAALANLPTSELIALAEHEAGLTLTDTEALTASDLVAGLPDLTTNELIDLALRLSNIDEDSQPMQRPRHAITEAERDVILSPKYLRYVLTPGATRPHIPA